METGLYIAWANKNPGIPGAFQRQKSRVLDSEEDPLFKRENFLPSGLYRRHRNFTGSIRTCAIKAEGRKVAGYTAGWELPGALFFPIRKMKSVRRHPTLKIYYSVLELPPAVNENSKKSQSIMKKVSNYRKTGNSLTFLLIKCKITLILFRGICMPRGYVV